MKKELELVTDVVKKSLEQTLKKDSEWVVREQAAKAIGRLRISELCESLGNVLLNGKNKHNTTKQKKKNKNKKTFQEKTIKQAK
jgi:hypothetical protein